MLSEHHDDSSETVGALTIPLESRVLGEFISGLLGQSRSIERQFLDRRFEIDFNWLLNLDQIISQRLASQNQAKLVSFSAKFTATKASFININDFSAQHLRRYGKNFDLIQYGVVLALIIGIAGGIFANRIYDFIKDWL
ncbi:hypothetical protein [Bradyrhizobium guangxiense]|uniref:hypothetical protein n=1 Tax=Bradyrhizobium guangxiense TaxID=1325115 RepID=UPI0010093C5A|nr:hypothetical protein [Bradyrhizobium guangxiense]